MKEVGLLILLLACIAVNAENKGPSEYLKLKWRALYTTRIQFYSRRCLKSCSPLDDDLFWNAVGGHAAMLESESEFMEYLEHEYIKHPKQFIANFQNIATSGIKYVDIDQNGIISEEEFYTEQLCLGYGLDLIKQLFDIHKMNDTGIPNDRYVVHLVKYMTDDNETIGVYDVFKNTSLSYNVDNPF